MRCSHSLWTRLAFCDQSECAAYTMYHGPCTPCSLRTGPGVFIEISGIGKFTTYRSSVRTYRMSNYQPPRCRAGTCQAEPLPRIGWWTYSVPYVRTYCIYVRTNLVRFGHQQASSIYCSNCASHLSHSTHSLTHYQLFLARPSLLHLASPSLFQLVHPVFHSFLLSSAVRHWLLPLPLARAPKPKTPNLLASSLLPPVRPALGQVSLHFYPRISSLCDNRSLLKKSTRWPCLLPPHLGSKLARFLRSRCLLQTIQKAILPPSIAGQVSMAPA